MLREVAATKYFKTGTCTPIGALHVLKRPEYIRVRSRKGVHKQARVFTPSIFIAQLPHMPSLQLRLNVNVGSTSFLILISASSIIGPVLFKSRVYVCILGLDVGSSGFHR